MHWDAAVRKHRPASHEGLFDRQSSRMLKEDCIFLRKRNPLTLSPHTGWRLSVWSRTEPCGKENFKFSCLHPQVTHPAVRYRNQEGDGDPGQRMICKHFTLQALSVVYTECVWMEVCLPVWRSDLHRDSSPELRSRGKRWCRKCK